MTQRIRLKLYKNTNTGKVHLHQVIKKQDGSFFTGEKSICGRHDRTDNHSELLEQETITNKLVLNKLLPKLKMNNMKHVLCEWCIMEIREK